MMNDAPEERTPEENLARAYYYLRQARLFVWITVVVTLINVVVLFAQRLP